jgi:hypothetical protein
VRNPRHGMSSCLLTALLVLCSNLPAALADPISGYTVTNLGSGPITLTTSNGTTVPVDSSGSFYGYYGGSLTSVTGGAPVVSVSNGQASYSFAFTPDTPLAPNQGVMSGFPLANAAPTYDGFTYGNPANAFSYVPGTALMNSQGLIAAADTYGVSGHWVAGTAYTVQENANGSFGAPTPTWSGTQQVNGGESLATGVNIVGLNNLGQVLGTTSNPYGNNPAAAVVYNPTMQTLTNLTNFTDSAGNMYLNSVPYAIDDQGRILLQASEWPTGAMDTLLLTPTSVSEAPVPEPGSIAVMVLAMAAFAAHRAAERRRRPS